VAPPHDPVRQWIEASVPAAKPGQRCLEIGCFPGRYLAVLGRMGYEVSGIDLTPSIARMQSAFGAAGLRTGTFIHTDFFACPAEPRYDVVCSFGFIEHFPDWQDALLKHTEHLAPGGLLVIETPNFRGWVQQLLHRLGDPANLRRHHLPAMRPRAWAALLRANGFDVLSHGYLGRFDFWTDSAPHFCQRALHGMLRSAAPLLGCLGSGRSSLAPYCVLIARKPWR
jgi:2-polyprenyl-3-methyl-5-hydroxy-6-metoxy-1,4-benzoquinol methylase